MRLALLPALLTFASCSSTPATHVPDIAPLSSLETIELSYKGAYSARGLPEPESSLAPGDSAHVGRVGVMVRLFEIDPSAILSLIDTDGVQLRADRVNREQAVASIRDLFKNGRAQLIGNPKITLNRGGRADLSVVNTFGFVESFELKPFGAGVLGDPQIGIGREGFQLEVAPALTDEDGQSTFEIKLSLATLLRPIQSTDREVPGSNASMTIQTPVYSTYELRLGATLAGSECLIIGPLPAIKFDSNPLMVLVTADSLPLPEDSEEQELGDEQLAPKDE